MSNTVCVKPIRNEEDYQQALTELDGLMDAEPGTEAFDRLDVLATLIQAYERKNHPIEPPHPIEAIRYHMESRRLSAAELEKALNVSRGSIADLLNGKRRLTVGMIRKLHEHLGIPTDVLIRDYAIEGEEDEGGSRAAMWPIIHVATNQGATNQGVDAAGHGKQENFGEYWSLRVTGSENPATNPPASLRAASGR
jgi:HTH-type transcriptional regulator/antitoxin HigA